MYSSFLLKVLLATTLLGGFAYSPIMGATEESSSKEVMPPKEQTLTYRHHRHNRRKPHWGRGQGHRGWHRGHRDHRRYEDRRWWHHHAPRYYR